jgi:hypothetical protein
MSCKKEDLKPPTDARPRSFIPAQEATRSHGAVTRLTLDRLRRIAHYSHKQATNSTPASTSATPPHCVDEPISEEGNGSADSKDHTDVRGPKDDSKALANSKESPADSSVDCKPALLCPEAPSNAKPREAASTTSGQFCAFPEVRPSLGPATVKADMKAETGRGFKSRPLMKVGADPDKKGRNGSLPQSQSQSDIRELTKRFFACEWEQECWRNPKLALGMWRGQSCRGLLHSGGVLALRELGVLSSILCAAREGRKGGARPSPSPTAGQAAFRHGPETGARRRCKRLRHQATG